MDDLRKEQLEAVALRVVEYLVGRALFNDTPAVEKDHAGRDLAGKAHFVRHDGKGHALVCKLLHDVEHFADHFGVERGGGLVKEDDLRVLAQRAGDSHTLLLAA